ncbi:unnamed protein product [Heterosigma akashiwo]
MKLALVILAVLLAVATAFVAPSTGRASTQINGYVPDGLTEAEYEAIKAEAAAKKVANKKKKVTGKFEDLTEWLMARDKKYPGTVGKGHRMAKANFDEAAFTRNSPRSAVNKNN